MSHPLLSVVSEYGEEAVRTFRERFLQEPSEKQWAFIDDLRHARDLAFSKFQPVETVHLDSAGLLIDETSDTPLRRERAASAH